MRVAPDDAQHVDHRDLLQAVVRMVPSLEVCARRPQNLIDIALGCMAAYHLSQQPGARCDEDYRKVVHEFSSFVSSQKMRAGLSGVPVDKFRLASSRVAAVQVFFGMALRASLEKAICERVPTADLLAYVDIVSFDGTPMKIGTSQTSHGIADIVRNLENVYA